MVAVQRKDMQDAEIAGDRSFVCPHRNQKARLQLVDQPVHYASHRLLLDHEMEGIGVRLRC